jgi:hypothetical protein
MAKVLHFVLDDNLQGEYPGPIPIKDALPDWYRKAEMYLQMPGRGNSPASGLKKCVPFMDALLTGYVFVTWEDMYVTRLPDGSVSLTSSGNGQLFSIRGEELGRTMPRPAGTRDEHLAWSHPWGWKTPRGWSTLVTHPLNRFDLPFVTTSGIVDSDNYFGPGNVPFFIKDGFEGVIPKGTPYLQVIPIKRANWIGSVSPLLAKGMRRLTSMVNEKASVYRDKFWIKKSYK